MRNPAAGMAAGWQCFDKGESENTRLTTTPQAPGLARAGDGAPGSPLCPLCGRDPRDPACCPPCPRCRAESRP